MKKQFALHIASLLLMSSSVAQQTGGPGRVVILGELALRQRAINVVAPGFPSKAIRGRASGIAVAAVFLDAKGSVSRVEVLQAPHPLIVKALETAILQWKIKPPVVNGDPLPSRGKLTFYYVIERGKGRVDDPIRVKHLNIGRKV